jgi:hypothetical protein
MNHFRVLPWVSWPFIFICTNDMPEVSATHVDMRSLPVSFMQPWLWIIRYPDAP